MVTCACSGAPSVYDGGGMAASSVSNSGLRSGLSGLRPVSGACSAARPTGTAALYSVDCPDATCVAVGSYTDTQGRLVPLVETLAGTTWTASALRADRVFF